MKNYRDIFVLSFCALILATGCWENQMPPSGKVTTTAVPEPPVLERIAFQIEEEPTNGKWTVKGPDGKRFEVIQDKVNGHFDKFEVHGDSVSLAGWGAGADSTLPMGFVFFVGNDCLGFVRPVSRPDVAAALKNPSLEKTGFNVEIPTEAVKGKPFKAFKIFVLTADGRALAMNAARANVGDNRKIWAEDGGPRKQ